MALLPNWSHSPWFKLVLQADRIHYITSTIAFGNPFLDLDRAQPFMWPCIVAVFCPESSDKHQPRPPVWLPLDVQRGAAQPGRAQRCHLCRKWRVLPRSLSLPRSSNTAAPLPMTCRSCIEPMEMYKMQMYKCTKCLQSVIKRDVQNRNSITRTWPAHFAHDLACARSSAMAYARMLHRMCRKIGERGPCRFRGKHGHKARINAQQPRFLYHHTEVDLGLARHSMRHSVSICTGRDCSVAWSMAWSWFSEFVASGGAVPSTSTSPSLPP